MKAKAFTVLYLELYNSTSSHAPVLCPVLSPIPGNHHPKSCVHCFLAFILYGFVSINIL